MSGMCLYDRNPSEADRGSPGGRLARPMACRIHGLAVWIEDSKPASGYRFGSPRSWPIFTSGQDRPNEIVPDELMGRPSEWLTLYVDYPVKCYLQHSLQENDIWLPKDPAV